MARDIKILAGPAKAGHVQNMAGDAGDSGGDACDGLALRADNDRSAFENRVVAGFDEVAAEFEIRRNILHREQAGNARTPDAAFMGDDLGQIMGDGGGVTGPGADMDILAILVKCVAGKRNPVLPAVEASDPEGSKIMAAQVPRVAKTPGEAFVMGGDELAIRPRLAWMVASVHQMLPRPARVPRSLRPR